MMLRRNLTTGSLLFLLASMPAAAAERKLVRRAITITDSSATTVSELHVAGGISTTLVFEVAIKERGVILADPTGSFFPPQVIERSILIIPKKDVPGGKPRTLTVTLADGTVLPFKMTSIPKEADLQVDVAVTVSPDSPQSLKAFVSQIRSQLDECQSNAGSAGIQKVAALIVNQDIAKPEAFTVERRNIRNIDKQARLLVELHHAYRLFGQTYLVLTVQNRDPSKTWVLDKPEVGLAGGSQTEDVKVVTYSSELAALPPDEVSKLVVVFNTPQRATEHKFYLSLLEKNGNRHFRIEDLSL